jgi:predicted nucleic acid-binding Zn finger protein
MTKDERLRALLGRGYFPDELPPPFTTQTFAKYRNAIGSAWKAHQHYPKTVPEIYSIPRAKKVRRDLSIVNPIAEFHVAKLIADNWVTLKKHLKSCDFSTMQVEINSDGRRAVSGPDFHLISLKQAEISASFDNILIADISRFYGTLYTHAIPWALHTKQWSKDNLNDPLYKNSLGAKLDAAVRKGKVILHFTNPL